MLKYEWRGKHQIQSIFWQHAFSPSLWEQLRLWPLKQHIMPLAYPHFLKSAGWQPVQEYLIEYLKLWHWTDFMSPDVSVRWKLPNYTWKPQLRPDPAKAIFSTWLCVLLNYKISHLAKRRVTSSFTCMVRGFMGPQIQEHMIAKILETWEVSLSLKYNILNYSRNNAIEMDKCYLWREPGLLGIREHESPGIHVERATVMSSWSIDFCQLQKNI